MDLAPDHDACLDPRTRRERLIEHSFQDSLYFITSSLLTDCCRQPTLYRRAVSWFNRESGVYHFLGCVDRP